MREFFPHRADNFVGGTVGTNRRIAHHHDAVNNIAPDVDTVLHDDDCCTGALGGGDHGVADIGHALGVDIRGGFIQEDQAGTHGQDAGEGQALLLPAGKLLSGVVKGNSQPDEVTGPPDTLPDFGTRETQILATEGNIVTNPRGNDL